jgi:hypothetical protein
MHHAEATARRRRGASAWRFVFWVVMICALRIGLGLFSYMAVSVAVYSPDDLSYTWLRVLVGVVGTLGGIVAIVGADPRRSLELAVRPFRQATLRDLRRGRRGRVGIVIALAIWLAGERQASSPGTWRAHLEDADHPLRTSFGLLKAALSMRKQDTTAWLGRLLDWWLATDGRVACACGAIFTSLTVALFKDGGLLAVAEAGEGLLALTAAPWGAALFLRRIRGVQL